MVLSQSQPKLEFMLPSLQGHMVPVSEAFTIKKFCAMEE